VILSVCFHIFSWNTSKYFSAWFTKLQNSAHHSEPIEISFQGNPKESNSSQIVRQADLPNEIEADTNKKERTKLFSEREQRVKVQSKATLFGLTKNRLYNSQKKNQIQKQLQVQNRLIPKQNETSILNHLNQHEGSDLTNANAFQNNPSTIGEMVPNTIKNGEFTALNTDRHLFYTFYSRVEEAIRYGWESDVQTTISNLNRNQYHNPTAIWSTRLDILLTKEGKFFKAILLKESGIRGLDLAAINAFRDANFFPHPPKEMVDDEGFIRLKYQFHVFYDPSAINNRVKL
jgi:hypothetical protein